MTTDISEKGFETLITRCMTGTNNLAVEPNHVAKQPPSCDGTYTTGKPQRDNSGEPEFEEN